MSDDTGDDTSGEQQEGQKGTADPGQKFREMEISDEEKQEMEEERERRLDPANRPENAEVDNTNRTFKDGRFVDDGDEDSEPPA